MKIFVLDDEKAAHLVDYLGGLGGNTGTFDLYSELFDQHNGIKPTMPQGWDVDIDADEQGGQPNGSGEIETSDSREWFSPARESHHRERIQVEITGPWLEGPTAGAKFTQEHAAKRRLREQAAREQDILRQAAEIQTRRAAEEA